MGILAPLPPAARRLRAITARAAAALFLASVVVSAFGQIPRSRAEVRAFRAEHTCPATGRNRGACPGFHVDHVVPLCAGGADHRSNMQWISVEDHRWKTFVDVRECRKQRVRERND